LGRRAAGGGGENEVDYSRAIRVDAQRKMLIGATKTEKGLGITRAEGKFTSGYEVAGGARSWK